MKKIKQGHIDFDKLLQSMKIELERASETPDPEPESAQPAENQLDHSTIAQDYIPSKPSVTSLYKWLKGLLGRK